jgi:hypothetical protein
VKIILFGAGASFGSEANKEYTPPLGPNLFKKLESRGGVASSIPDEIKSLFHEDFESGMREYNIYTNNNSMTFQRELAHYLAEFSPNENNAYSEVIKEFGVNNITYVSLNYDLLFEQCAGQMNFGITYSSKKQNMMASLLKIHGSSNFWPTISLGGGITFSGNKVDVESDVQPLNQIQTLKRCKEDKGLAPALAHYAVGKDIKVCPSFVSRQSDEWKVSVTEAKKIAVIGVKVHEVDTHIWDELGKSKASIWYVGFDSDKAAFNVWKERHNKTNAFFIESDFQSCVSIIEKHFKGN